MFKRNTRLSAPLAMAILSMVGGTQTAFGFTQEIEDALKFYDDGKSGAIKFDLNYRYENAHQENALETANANTARLRLGYLTPVWHGLQGFAEYEGNLVLQDDYNSLRNGNTGYSVVADPSVSELNRFWLAYTGLEGALFKLGRQRIKWDDDRFIGNVGWRQLEQTYDSFLTSYSHPSLPELEAKFAYLANVQTIIGTSENIEAPLLNINYKLGDFGNAIAYAYWLDYTERENFEKSSQTYGLRLHCCDKPLASYKLTDAIGVAYTAEWGHQSDYGNGATSYDVDRLNLMGGVSVFGVMFQGAVEQLDGTGLNQTFDTPLGTNHAFQGWADLFLQTPANGIRDVFGTVMAPLPIPGVDVVLAGIYHGFSDDTGALDYGDEWDLQATAKFGKHYSLLIKYATYNAGGVLPNVDTQKFWLQGNISF